MLNKKLIATGIGVLGGIAFMTSEEALAYSKNIEDSYFSSDLKNGVEKHYLSEDMISQNPSDYITRAEFAAIIYNATNANSNNISIEFSDVNKNHKYYQEIQEAAKLGLLAGYVDGTFKPDAKITREEMAILLERFLTNEGFSYENIDNSSVYKVFQDINNSKYTSIINKLKNVGILAGYGDNTYKPYANISKEEAIALFLRSDNALKLENANLINKAIITGPINVRYTPEFSSTAFGFLPKDAVVYYEKYNENWYLINFEGKLGYIYAPYVEDYIDNTYAGVAYAKQLVNIYNEKNEAVTYVATGTEIFVKKVDVAANKAFVTTGSFEGYVKYDEINYIPMLAAVNRSYYALNDNNEVLHYIYNSVTKKYSSYIIGKNNSSLNLVKGTKYYSPNNTTINETEVYPYYNYLPLRTKSNITGAQIDAYIKSQSPNSPLIGLGNTFVDAANKNNLNAMYLVANALHESSYGTSAIAKDKKNLFGFKAYDASAYDSAAAFTTFEEGIYYCAAFISDNYLNPTSWRYFGAVTGDKSIGMNVKYASDIDWGAKIAGHMYRMDKSINFKDLNKYSYGELKAGTLVYNSSGTKIKSLDKKRIVAIETEVTISGKGFYKVIADEKSLGYFYVLKSGFQKYNTF